MLIILHFEAITTKDMCEVFIWLIRMNHKVKKCAKVCNHMQTCVNVRKNMYNFWKGLLKYETVYKQKNFNSVH